MKNLIRAALIGLLLAMPSLLGSAQTCRSGLLSHTVPQRPSLAPDGAGDIRPMRVERLADLNVARSGHTLVSLNGELTVIGGHTTGFVLTATAEYYKDGSWHLVESIYPHDNGLFAALPSGEVLLGGGAAEAFGVGRSWGVESYDPLKHTFTPKPLLDRQRMLASAARMSDGSVVISGNWYAEDNIEVYSPQSGSTAFKPAAQSRRVPFILQTSADNAIIFSGYDDRGQPHETILIDRLIGEAFEEPLLNEWRPAGYEANLQIDHLFIGDEALGGYAWLIPVLRTTDNQCAILKLVGEHFELLPTKSPIPMHGQDGEPITWGSLHADKSRECAYLIGAGTQSNHVYLCRIGYGEALKGGNAALTFFGATLPTPVLEIYHTLLPGGRMALAGGSAADNLNPFAAAYILHTEPLPETSSFPWKTIAAGILLAGICIATLAVNRSKKHRSITPAESEQSEIVRGEALFTNMATRIQRLMEEKELFRNPDLKVEDIAAELGTNVAYVRGCISGNFGASFRDFVNGYRIRYVQRLLKENPDAKIGTLAEEAGFSSSATFYRQFAAATGLSPATWLQQQNNAQR